jgi:phage baseplate assembly protein W
MDSVFFDYPIDGAMDSQGHLVALFQTDAVNNALACWISSFRGEQIRNPGFGGSIIGLLEKNVDPQTAEDVASLIRSEIAYGFQPAFTIYNLTVEADMKHDRYNITIQGYCPLLKQYVNYYDQLGRLLA